MGQMSSSHFNSRSNGRRSLRSPFMRRSKLNSSNLSHTFNMPSIDNHIELININISSEEQLMTLPGINRPIAQAIVEHRQAIGRFKRVDDLALVSGIGAEKLELLRSEICTVRHVPSRNSSRAQSLDSLKSSVESIRPLININKASVFQLQCVPGLNQELAANIIDYRLKKGPFKALEDLMKVKGLSTIRVNAIKQHLALESIKRDDKDQHACIGNGNLKNLNGCVKANSNGVNGNGAPNGIPRTPGHRKTMSVPVKYSTNYANGFSTAPVNDIYELLSAYSYRPIIEEDFMYVRDGKMSVRIATWNLHNLSIDKASNPGFREVVCCTILENRVSVVCVQDIIDEEALKIIAEELNLPALRRIQEKKYNSRRWQSYVVPKNGSNRKCLGFLYDADCEDIQIQLKSLKDYSSSINDNSRTEQIVDAFDSLSSKKSSLSNVVIVSCIILNLQLLVVSFHVSEESNEDISIIDGIWQIVNDTKHKALLLGDFYDSKYIEGIHTYHRTISENAETMLDVCNGPKGRSDILMSGPMSERFTGHCGTIRYGLNHMAIPRGWSWGGSASPHCPVWAEFFIE